MIIAVDFDGTVVIHEYPRIGRPVPYAAKTLRGLAALDHQIILWTMRDGQELHAAIAYMHGRNIPLHGVNRNPDQNWTTSPKAYAHLYIDDAAFGCPLIRPKDGTRAYVDWRAVHESLIGPMR